MNSLRSHNGIRLPRLLRPWPKKPLVYQQTRHFHPVDWSTAFIYGIHSFTGLPWVYSIPLTAVIVRTMIAFPLQAYTKIQAHKERDIRPILEAHMIRLMKKEQEKGSYISPSRQLYVKMEMRTIRARLQRSWGISPYYAPLNYIQFPVWLLLMESVRSMTGSGQGLVGYLSSIFDFESRPPVEQSLSTEGAFWFPDLLAGDPTGILPLMLAGSVFVNIYVGWKLPHMSEDHDLPDIHMYRNMFFRAAKITGQGLACVIGALSFFKEMPVALLLYWLTSTNTATMQNLFLEKLMSPLKPLKSRRKIFISFDGAERTASKSKSI